MTTFLRLFPSLEVRVKSPSLGSKEISRCKRASLQDKQERMWLESVKINICWINRHRARGFWLYDCGTDCSRELTDSEERKWKLQEETGLCPEPALWSQHRMSLACCHLCSLIIALHLYLWPLVSHRCAAGFSFPSLPSKHICPMSWPLRGLLTAIHSHS